MGIVTTNPLLADLNHVLDHTRDLWDELRGERIFITGGTGFFGCWLLESFAWINDQLGLNASALVLTRNPEAFQNKKPHLALHPAIRFQTGDMQSFEFPNGEFSHIIHAATETNLSLVQIESLTLFDANIQGARRVLELACTCGASKFLFTSSGAVYGKQPHEITHISEDYAGAPMTVDIQTSYGQSKRIAEFLCTMYAHNHGLQAMIARCFAFVGPWLPLDSNYAIGNFIRDGLNGGPIIVNGDGTPHRSYLYAADLAIWLWTILFKGQSCRLYNVGSENDLSITELAKEVAKAISLQIPIKFLRQPSPNQVIERYVPSTQRARTELGLDVYVKLQDAIRRTASWYEPYVRKE
jgi:dTDP-glucose 4,6-dehydratase